MAKTQNPPLPVPYRYRPKVPKKPQTCAARHDEGAGTLAHLIKSFRPDLIFWE
ncbi:MAG: hypothetical protein Q9188_002159 [Gyalolechia gomerana]